MFWWVTIYRDHWYDQLRGHVIQGNPDQCVHLVCPPSAHLLMFVKRPVAVVGALTTAVQRCVVWYAGVSVELVGSGGQCRAVLFGMPVFRSTWSGQEFGLSPGPDLRTGLRDPRCGDPRYWAGHCWDQWPIEHTEEFQIPGIHR